MTDTHAVALPALDGRDPLGFLTALGTTVLTGGRLCFDDLDATATLHSRHASIDAIVDTLTEIVHHMDDDALLPGVPPGFPKSKAGSGPDPMRVDRNDFRVLVDQYRSDPAALAWMTSLVTDLSGDNKNRVTISAFMAPSGQQSIGTYFKTALDLVRRHPAHLRHALTGWQRVDGFSGEYLDHRALASAADHPSGRSVESGVPGATWLAIMALPLLRITGIRGRPAATTCHVRS